MGPGLQSERGRDSQLLTLCLEEEGPWGSLGCPPHPQAGLQQWASFFSGEPQSLLVLILAPCRPEATAREQRARAQGCRLPKLFTAAPSLDRPSPRQLLPLPAPGYRQLQCQKLVPCVWGGNQVGVPWHTPIISAMARAHRAPGAHIPHIPLAHPTSWPKPTGSIPT